MEKPPWGFLERVVLNVGSTWVLNLGAILGANSGGGVFNPFKNRVRANLEDNSESTVSTWLLGALWICVVPDGC